MKGKKLNIFGSALIGLAALVNGVNANELSTFLDANSLPNIQNSSSELAHHSQPVLFNADFIYGNSPAVDIFYGEDLNRKKLIGESAENMDTQTATVSGRGLIAPQSCELDTDIRVASFAGMFPEENMIDKEMTRDIYDCRTDPNGVLVESYDTKALDKSGMNIPLEVQNGLSYKVVDSFDSSTSWARSDANRDGIVNLKDFSTLDKFYGETCSTIAGTQDKYDCFSIDTNDDGIIDLQDVMNLADDYLQGE